jgi:hypothetical protein
MHDGGIKDTLDHENRTKKNMTRTVDRQACVCPSCLGALANRFTRSYGYDVVAVTINLHSRRAFKRAASGFVEACQAHAKQYRAKKILDFCYIHWRRMETY